MGRIPRKKRKHFYKKIPKRAIRKANRRRPPSSLEKKVQDWLTEDGIYFKREFPVGQCHVDIFLPPETLVELNGCHWHGCTKCNEKLSHAQLTAREKDARRYAFLESEGFKLVVIWECEVEHFPRKVRRRLRELSMEHKKDDR